MTQYACVYVSVYVAEAEPVCVFPHAVHQTFALLSVQFLLYTVSSTDFPFCVLTRDFKHFPLPSSF